MTNLTRHQAFLLKKWQARRDSNPQHSVLETDALPIELLTYNTNRETRVPDLNSFTYRIIAVTLATTPAPTVRPPSRIAKRRPGSIAIGWIKFY